MRISENQLRRIINEELITQILREQAAPTPSAEQQAAAAENVKWSGSVVTWSDKDYHYSVDTSQGGKILTAKTGQQLVEIDPASTKPRDVKARTAINAVAAQLNAARSTAGDGSQLPGCNLASLKDPLTQQLISIAKIGVGTAFYVDLIVGQAMSVQPAELITAGQKLAGMGEQAQGSLVKKFLAGVADAAVGPMNELVGALLQFLGTFAQGVVDAKTAFISGAPGVKCSFKAFAAAIGRAYAAAVGAHLAAIQAGFADVGQALSKLGTVIAGILSAVGGAVAAAAATVAAVLGALVALGVAGIKGLGSLIQQAIIAAGEALIGAGTAVKAAAGAPPVSESIKVKNLDRLALEMCTLTYARNLLRENVSIENRALVLM